MGELDPKTARSMRAAARAVLDTPGLVERLADVCLKTFLLKHDGWEREAVAAAIREACEETANGGTDG